MVGNIGIGIANAIGFKHIISKGGGGGGPISYPGLIAAWSAKGKSNDDEDRAILKDLTGNGHDITLNGFAFSEMSGYGGYNYNFANWYSTTVETEFKSKTIAIINGYPSTRGVFEKNLGTATPKTILRLRVYVEIKNNSKNLPLRLYFTGSNIATDDKEIDIIESGIYEIPQINVDGYRNNGFYIGFVFNNSNTLEGDENYYCKIELLPEYPDALVFDGVDDYGINEDMPILTDYTIIAKRKDYTGACLFTKGEDIYNSAFIFEGEIFTFNTYNFGRRQNVNLLKDLDISWQTKLFYNEQLLLPGDMSDKKGAFLGKISIVDKRFFKGAFYSAYLFDRSLDEQEIKSFIRKYIDPEYLLPSEIPIERSR